MHYTSFCYKCGLWQTCIHPDIQGRGNFSSKILILGEAPGAEEDTLNQVFVGKSGKVLSYYIESAGITSSDYFISNAVKCRPESNRTPLPKEISSCSPKTYKLILEMKPKVIITLGKVPATQLLKLKLDQEILRGKLYYHPVFNCYILPTWHPAYINYSQDVVVENQLLTDLKLAKCVSQKPLPRILISTPRSLKDPLEIKKYLDHLLTVEEFSCDIETTGKSKSDAVNPRVGRITDISFCSKPGEGVHIKWSDILPFERELKEVLRNPHSKKIGHNFRFDKKFLRACGFEVNNYYFDTMLAYHTMNMVHEGAQKSGFDLDTMSWLFSYQGNYKSILEDYGGIGNYQVDSENESISNSKSEKSTTSKKASKEDQAIQALSGSANALKIEVNDITKSPTDIESIEEVMKRVIDRFDHVNDVNKDTSILDSFVREKKSSRTLVLSPEDIAAGKNTNAFYIDQEADEDLKYYSTFIAEWSRRTLEELNLTPLQYYSAMDSDVTLQIYHRLKKEIDSTYSWVFYNLIMPLSDTLLRLEENGVCIDLEYMSKLEKDTEKNIEAVKKKFFKDAKCTFNIDSPLELGEFMYKTLGIEPHRDYMTKGGKTGTDKKPSTDKNAIEFFSKKYTKLKPLLEYRELTKQYRTYIVGFKKLIDPVTGRIHGSFLQHTTATGRLSSTSPNLQNIPTDSKIRHMFVPSKGNKLICCDLSQAELRILAMMSNDQKMLDAFASGHDFHTYTACLLFNIDINAFDKENPNHAKYRKLAKCINFGIAYQMGASSLAADLEIGLEQAQEFIDQFYRTYTNVKRWVDTTMSFAATHGYVETLHGRRRYLPKVYSSKEAEKARALRQAVNTPIQGTASDCACFGLIKILQYIDEHCLAAKPIMIIHDEIVVDTPFSEIDIISEKLELFMTTDIPKVTIPLVADLHVLDKWEK